MHLQPEFAQEVTDILMEDERVVLQLGRTEHFSKYKKTL
jgi:DNA primase